MTISDTTAGRDDLLHHQRDHADHLVHRLHRRDHGERHGDTRSHRGRDRLLLNSASGNGGLHHQRRLQPRRPSRLLQARTPRAQSVTISDATPGATIYYTTNGTTPTTSSTVYSGPITVSATETVNAIAIASGYTTSSVGVAPYTIGAAPPAINFASGFTATGLNLLGATIVSSTLEVTDGGAGEERAAWFTTPVNIQAFVTDFSFQDTSATADGMTFTIQNYAPGIWSVGGNGADLGYGGIGSSVAIKFDLYSNAGEGSDSTGFYTDGAVPTVPAIDMTSSGVNLHSGDILHAHVTYDGTTLTLTLTDTVTNASFTTSQAINIPTTVGASTAYVGFTGSTGGSTAVQQVLNWTYTVN